MPADFYLWTVSYQVEVELAPGEDRDHTRYRHTIDYTNHRIVSGFTIEDVLADIREAAEIGVEWEDEGIRKVSVGVRTTSAVRGVRLDYISRRVNAQT